MSKVYLEDIWAEDLFSWYEDHISSSCGDGGAAICCGNPSEVSMWFVDWWAAKHGVDANGDMPTLVGNKNHVVHYGLTRFPHSRDEYQREDTLFINYHDSNENYIFCDKEVDIGHHDYSFVIIGDCRFGWNSQWKDRVIKPVLKS